MSSNQASVEFELRDYLRVLRRRKLTILLVVVLGLGATAAFTFLQTPKYTATAQVLIQPSTAPPQLSGSATTVLEPSDIQTQVELINSAPVQAAVTRQLGRVPRPSVSSVPQTDVINVSATDVNPRRAAAIANTYANSYVNVRRTQTVNSLLDAAQQIQARIQDVDNQIAAIDAEVAQTPSSRRSLVSDQLSPQRSALANEEAAFRSQLGQLQINSAVNTGGAQVATPATVPTSPSSPHVVLNLLVGLGVSVVIGVGVAFLRDFLRDSIETTEDLERAGNGVSVLGVVPRSREWKEKSEARLLTLTDPDSPSAEAYRSIRNSVRFLQLESPVKMLQITSASAGEGKTTMAANLGVVLAKGGKSVCVVCCDLRRPRLHEFFGLYKEPGFTSALLDDCALEDVRQRVPGVNNLSIIASGPVPHNPSDLLISAPAESMLAQVRTAADLVILDCPPVLPVSDAASLSTYVDATLFVVAAGQTSRKSFTRALNAVRQVGSPKVISVVNGVVGDEAYGYGRGYGYYDDDSPLHTEKTNGSQRPAVGDRPLRSQA